MELTFHGLSCVRLKGRDVDVIIDPPAHLPPSLARVEPHVIVRTDGATDPGLLRVHDGRPQEVMGPGEFEVRGVAVMGVPARGVTLMRVEVDDVRVVALGKLDQQLSEDQIDTLGHVDVLIVPIGGGDALNAAEATKLVNAVGPAVVVPVRYRAAGTSSAEYDSVETFAKEMGGAEALASQPKLTLTGSGGSSDDTRVVILDSRP